MWIERFSKVAKDDLLLSKNDLIATNAKLTGNVYIRGYAIRQWLSIKTDDGNRLWLSESLVYL